MSWLFSQALAEEYLGVIFLDGAQSAPLSETPTQQAYCSRGKMTECSRLSRFGMTFAPLTESRGEELLTLYLADFRARTLARQEPEQELTESEAAYGERWHESSVRYDRDLHSWKTHLCLWDEVLPWSSVTLPKWGMTRSGFVFQHPTAERPISVTVSGLWPTPQASDNRDRGNLSSPAIKRRAEKGKQLMLSQVVSDQNGRLNPTWVEWLMGWPLGWTDLKPLEMARFHEWQQQHSES